MNFKKRGELKKLFMIGIVMLFCFVVYMVLAQESTTTVGETWGASITPNDGNADGITKYSNSLIIQ